MTHRATEKDRASCPRCWTVKYSMCWTRRRSWSLKKRTSLDGRGSSEKRLIESFDPRYALQLARGPKSFCKHTPIPTHPFHRRRYRIHSTMPSYGGLHGCSKGKASSDSTYKTTLQQNRGHYLTSSGLLKAYDARSWTFVACGC